MSSSYQPEPNPYHLEHIGFTHVLEFGGLYVTKQITPSESANVRCIINGVSNYPCEESESYDIWIDDFELGVKEFEEFKANSLEEFNEKVMAYLGKHFGDLG